MFTMKTMFTSLAILACLAASASAEPVDYLYSTDFGNGVTITGYVTVETTAPGCEPGGTVSWGNGITAFYFAATNGSITEVIDSSLFTPTPQTMNLNLSSTNFPEVASWDFSFSNQSYGGTLIQAITVHSPSNPGYDDWTGIQLNGFVQPSHGVWTAPQGVVPTESSTWGNAQALFR